MLWSQVQISFGASHTLKINFFFTILSFSFLKLTELPVDCPLRWWLFPFLSSLNFLQFYYFCQSVSISFSLLYLFALFNYLFSDWFFLSSPFFLTFHCLINAVQELTTDSDKRIWMQSIYSSICQCSCWRRWCVCSHFVGLTWSTVW